MGILLAPLITAQQANEPEISAEETQPNFTIHSSSSEVLVRVIVRDPQGNVVSDLTKSDFRLLDNGKPQSILQFSLEHSGVAAPPATSAEKPATAQAEVQPMPLPAPPGRFVAFYFDDVYMSTEDVVRTRDAAERYLKSSLAPGDRIAIYTSSGSQHLDFTSDRDQFNTVMAKVSPHPMAAAFETSHCPFMSEYEAYQIAEKENPQAIELSVAKIIQCMCQTNIALPSTIPAGTNPQINPCPFDPTVRVKTTARSIWEEAQTAMEKSLGGLEDLVRRLSVMPGQRSILWVSPGFLGMDQNTRLNWLTDQALKARVVINSLDSRGLWTSIPGGDASRSAGDLRLTGRMVGIETSLTQTSQNTTSAVLEEAAAATGGVFVHDTNDYDGGFRRAGGMPESAYLLSFSPLNMKYDGKYHKLSVELVNHKGLILQARRGYFAPSEAPNAERQAREDLEIEVFAHEDRNDLPLGIQTQFFISNDMEGQLSVLAHVDLHGTRLRKEQQVSVGQLKFVTALFDGNGNFLEGQSRTINLRLKDATLEKLLASGVRTGWKFKVKPGTYVVREVVQDSTSGGIAALSRTVEIPFP